MDEGEHPNRLPHKHNVQGWKAAIDSTDDHGPRPGRKVKRISDMKHVMMAALLLLCISFPASLEARHKVPRYLNKESSIDMSNMKRIFLGWVDLEPDAWALYGYSSRTEWANTISSLNADFA